MRKILTLILLVISMTILAQPNYKYILAHLSELSDGEALYQLKEYQAFFPKEAHPYYLMANIHYQTYSKEHPLINYTELSSALYDIILYYGNCAYFIKNDAVKKDWYAATAKNGKVNEETVIAYVNKRKQKIEDVRTKVDELHSAYTMLVNRYDSCLREMTEFSLRYTGQKEAQLLANDADIAQLQLLNSQARQLPKDIERLRKALINYPIDGYNPQFTFRTIDHFRMEGLTTSNFLENDIQLWDFAAWTETFLNSRDHDLLPYLKALEEEYALQDKAWNMGQGSEQNRLLINTIDYRDEGSAMSQLMKLQYCAVQVRELEQRIMATDTVDDDTWIIMLQQNYRILALLDQSQTLKKGLVTALNEPELMRKYNTFITRFFPNERAWGATAVALWSNKMEQCYSNTCNRLVQIAQEQQKTVQISEQTLAVIEDGKLLYKQHIANERMY